MTARTGELTARKLTSPERTNQQLFDIDHNSEKRERGTRCEQGMRSGSRRWAEGVAIIAPCKHTGARGVASAVPHL